MCQWSLRCKMFIRSLTCKREEEEAYLDRGRSWAAHRPGEPPPTEDRQSSVLCWLKWLAFLSPHSITEQRQSRKIHDLRQESFSSWGHSESCLLEAVCWPQSPQPGRRSFLREDLALPCGALIIISINTCLLYTYIIIFIWAVKNRNKIVCLRSCG